jgi:hypothetical protein
LKVTHCICWSSINFFEETLPLPAMVQWAWLAQGVPALLKKRNLARLQETIMPI